MDVLSGLTKYRSQLICGILKRENSFSSPLRIPLELTISTKKTNVLHFSAEMSLLLQQVKLHDRDPKT